MFKPFPSHLLLASCLLAGASNPALAQWRVGGALGAEHDSSWDEFLVLTLEARGPIAQGRVELAPRFSYFLRDGVSRFQIDANVIKPLPLASPLKVTPYAGLGAALEKFSVEGSDGETAFGLNYVVGATTRNAGRLQGYGQFQYSVLHDSPNTAVVSAGLFFQPGGR